MTQIKGLPNKSTFASNDKFPVQDGASDQTDHATYGDIAASILAAISDGWWAVTDAWTYASATTVTVPSDATTKYSVGDKIKLTQSATTKYFYVTAVTSTLLTLDGGAASSPYTVANSAITNIYRSNSETPLNFPPTKKFDLVRYRQGGTSGDAAWNTNGTTNTDTSAKAAFIQVGCNIGSTGGDVTVTFPIAYSQVPIVIPGNGGAGGANSWPELISTTATTFTFRCIDAGGTLRAEKVNWIAVGQ